MSSPFLRLTAVVFLSMPLHKTMLEHYQTAILNVRCIWPDSQIQHDRSFWQTNQNARLLWSSIHNVSFRILDCREVRNSESVRQRFNCLPKHQQTFGVIYSRRTNEILTIVQIMTVLYILPNSKPLYINFNKTLLLRSKE